MNERSLKFVRHLERAEVKVVDARLGKIHAVVSTETRDRDGDIIRASGWDVDNFMANPVMLDSHRYGSIEAIIGQWTAMATRGKSLVGEATYDVGQGIPAADRGFQLAQEGRAAFSVGFIPDMSKAKEIKATDSMWPNYEFNGQELLEVSQVSVPANPDALQRMKGFHPVIDGIVDEVLGDGINRIKYAIEQSAAEEAFLKENPGIFTPEEVCFLSGLITLTQNEHLEERIKLLELGYKALLELGDELAEAHEKETEEPEPDPPIASVFREALQEAFSHA